jgi:ABC-2 type transport system ATP-binding protein
MSPAEAAPVGAPPTRRVRVHEVVKQFGTLRAVDGVSFEIAAGEIFGILGPNGSGKTTTIRMMCGLLSATSGSIEVAGVDVRADPDLVKSRIGYMSQSFGLYGDLTVLENLRFYGGVYELGARWRERADWAMRTMRIDEARDRLAQTLSGGNRQRLALGCAILHEPPVLFLDEPTAGVDPAARRLFWAIIRDLAAAGTSIVVTTHYMDEAERFDRLAFLSNGKRMALGTPAEVRASFGVGLTLEDIFVKLQEQNA